MLGFEPLGEMECRYHFHFGCIHLTVLNSCCVCNADPSKTEEVLGTVTTSLCDLLPHAECWVSRSLQDTAPFVSATPDLGVEVLVLISAWMMEVTDQSKGNSTQSNWKISFLTRPPAHTPTPQSPLNYTGQSVSFLCRTSCRYNTYCTTGLW